MEHGLPYLVNCSILFTETPLLERPAAAKAAGFDAVEFWWPFDDAGPSDPDVDRFVSAVQDAGVQLVGLNFAAGDMPGGDRGLVSWPGRSAEFHDSVATRRVGSARHRAFNALYRNRIDGSNRRTRTTLAATKHRARRRGGPRTERSVLGTGSGATRYPLLVPTTTPARTRRAAYGADTSGGWPSLPTSVNGDDLAPRGPHQAGSVTSIADARKPRARHRGARPRTAPAGAAAAGTPLVGMVRATNPPRAGLMAPRDRRAAQPRT